MCLQSNGFNIFLEKKRCRAVTLTQNVETSVVFVCKSTTVNALQVLNAEALKLAQVYNLVKGYN